MLWFRGKGTSTSPFLVPVDPTDPVSHYPFWLQRIENRQVPNSKTTRNVFEICLPVTHITDAKLAKATKPVDKDGSLLKPFGRSCLIIEVPSILAWMLDCEKYNKSSNESCIATNTQRAQEVKRAAAVT